MSYRKNTVRFAVDFANKQIIATEANLNRAKRFGSDEYNELCKLMNAHPQFAVVKKEISQSAKKKTYKQLSFAFMEEYISINPRAEEMMLEYETVKGAALDWETSAYPRVKSWFLQKFGTENEPFDMKKAEQEVIEYRKEHARISA